MASMSARALWGWTLGVALAACSSGVEEGVQDSDTSEDSGQVTDSGSTDGCIRMDRGNIDEVPPAGLAISFRVLGCDGETLRQLTDDDVSVINDESGAAFDEGGGGKVSQVSPVRLVDVWTLVALDLSDGIFTDMLDDELQTALDGWAEDVFGNASSGVRVHAAVVGYGAPGQLNMYTPLGSERVLMNDGTVVNVPDLTTMFTDDADDFKDMVDAAIDAGPRGSRDMYNAYIASLDVLRSVGSAGGLQETVAVFLTGGTHNAGDSASLGALANGAQNAFGGTVYTVALGGLTDDPNIQALATRPSTYLKGSAGSLSGTFDAVQEKMFAAARSNYAIGVCTPVALGSPSATLTVTLDGATQSIKLPYFTDELTGSVSGCDPIDVASKVGVPF